MKKIISFRHAVLFILLIEISGCASLSSVSNPSLGHRDGLIYYMPKKDFQVTLTVAQGLVTTISLETTLAYPDLTSAYVLHHSNGFFAKNTVDVEVINGLISTTKSTMKSEVNEALKNLAGTIGTTQNAKTADFVASQDSDKKCADGTHKFIFDSEVSEERCGAKIIISRKYTSALPKTDKQNNIDYSGIFYRLNEPYLVTVNAQKTYAAAILLSPSLSPTYFLPIKKTFFANNDASFSFDAGVPIKYKQDTDSEAVALFKLPAEILLAYFSAIGGVFNAFKTNDTAEKEALAANLQLELMKKKYDACVLAIQEGDTTKIAALGCGK